MDDVAHSLAGLLPAESAVRLRARRVARNPRRASARSPPSRPLLDVGREREGIDLSKVVLTHHS